MIKKSEKIVISILAIITIIVIIMVIRGKNNNKNGENKAAENIKEEKYVELLVDGTKLNNSPKLKETKKVDNLEIGNIQLTNQNGQSVLLAEVKNVGTRKTEVTLIDIILYDDKGKEIAKVPGIISGLEVGQTTQLNTATQNDYANAYDFKIIKK